MKSELIPIEIIENKILVIRGQKVMLDSDLAELYGVETKMLNRAVKRNIERFPDNFMFQLTDEEWDFLRCQFGTSNETRGGRRFTPYAFTEHGVVMLSSVLNSKRAVAVNIQVVNAFIKLREIALTHKEVFQRFDELEKRFITYTKDTNIELSEHEQKINEIFKQLDYLKDITKPSQIGFKPE